MENFVSLKISEEEKIDYFHPLAGSITRTELIFFFANKFEILYLNRGIISLRLLYENFILWLISFQYSFPDMTSVIN